MLCGLQRCIYMDVHGYGLSSAWERARDTRALVVVYVIGASRSEPHTSALIDFRFACLLVLVC